jgi:hypothetical protein
VPRLPRWCFAPIFPTLLACGGHDGGGSRPPAGPTNPGTAFAVASATAMPAFGSTMPVGQAAQLTLRIVSDQPGQIEAALPPVGGGTGHPINRAPAGRTERLVVSCDIAGHGQVEVTFTPQGSAPMAPVTNGAWVFECVK